MPFEELDFQDQLIIFFNSILSWIKVDNVTFFVALILLLTTMGFVLFFLSWMVFGNCCCCCSIEIFKLIFGKNGIFRNKENQYQKLKVDVIELIHNDGTESVKSCGKSDEPRDDKSGEEIIIENDYVSVNFKYSNPDDDLGSNSDLIDLVKPKKHKMKKLVKHD